MKKQLKKLSLSKKVVANFNGVKGGRPPKTHGQTCAALTCEYCGPSDNYGCQDTIIVSLIVGAPCQN